MAVSTFRYAGQSDLRKVFPGYGKYLSRLHLKEFTQVSGDQWQMGSVGTTPSVVYFDGIEGTEVTTSAADVDTAKEWYYDPSTDLITIYVATASDDPNDDEIIEVGEDKDTLVNQHLTDAAMELHNMLDSRFIKPIPKQFQYSADPNNDTPEYDYILKRMNCLVALKNMVKTRGDFELADKFYAELTNENDTGLVQKFNSGEYKFAYEIDPTDTEIIEVTKAGTMALVEVYGDYSGGSIFDRIQVICTMGGAYGTAIVSVKETDGDKLYGSTTDDIKVTGGLQSLTGGIYARFEGASMTANDRWDIIVRDYHLEQTNAKTKVAELTYR